MDEAKTSRQLSLIVSNIFCPPKKTQMHCLDFTSFFNILNPRGTSPHLSAVH